MLSHRQAVDILSVYYGRYAMYFEEHGDTYAQDFSYMPGTYKLPITTYGPADYALSHDLHNEVMGRFQHLFHVRKVSGDDPREYRKVWKLVYNIFPQFYHSELDKIKLKHFNEVFYELTVEQIETYPLWLEDV